MCIAEGVKQLPTHEEVAEESDLQQNLTQNATGRITNRARNITGTQSSLAHIGRPIPQVSHIHDPVSTTSVFSTLPSAPCIIQPPPLPHGCQFFSVKFDSWYTEKCKRK